MPRIKFMNIEIDNFTMQETLDAIDNLIQKRENAYIVTPNVDHLVKLQKDMEFKECYDHANLVITDGKPLIWISKLYKTPIKEKVSGSDLFPLLCELAARKNYTMYFLGAAEGVAEKAADILEEQYKGLKVVGTYSPAYGFEKDPAQIADIKKRITDSRPDILIVALGAPKQEKFMYKYKDELQVPVSLGLGASLDFVAGNVKRAPRWMSNCGLEWLYRIFQEPKRMFKRYIIDDSKMIPMIWKYRK